ncbi:MAG: hypothetical protein FJX72_21195 [Armatimonadetes bacterium]|nr:hypothetical protein [Armatimonadota bacterium]
MMRGTGSEGEMQGGPAGGGLHQRGHVWALLSSGLTPRERITPPNLAGDIMVARYNADGSAIFASDCEHPCRTFAITRDYRFRWSIEAMDTRGMDYSTINNTVLAYEFVRFPGERRHRIVELDADSGRITHALEETSLGPIGNPIPVTGIGCVYYHPADHGKFWVVDSEHHCVYCTDWSGRIHVRYGEYGVQGSDAAHLHYPVCIAPSLIHRDGAVVVSDWKNHRVLNFAQSGRLNALLPFPFPYASYVNDSNCLAVFNGGNPPGGWYGIFLLGDGTQAVPRYHIPMNTNFIVSHPTIPFRFLLSWDCSLYEIDYRERVYQETPGAPPIQCPLFSRTEHPAGASRRETSRPLQPSESVCSPPIVDWFRPDKNIVLKATAEGRVVLEAARFVTPEYGNWDGGWEPVEEYGLPAGRAASIHVPRPFGVCRLRVELASTGYLEGWVALGGH